MFRPLACAVLVKAVVAVNNGLARTPQMGWNNWNSLGCDVSQDLLLDTSKILKSSGLQDLGYKYVVLDDCWSDGRDAQGSLVVDATKFPKGMKHVADTLHDMGFLFGMYSSAGELTCARYEGSLDHEPEDARSFASWDVDYLKYDNCFHKGRFGFPEVSFNRYNEMAKALNATQRPMLYSLCSWGEDYVHTWGMSIANSWRISGDIYDHFNRPDALCSCTNPVICSAPGSHCSVMNIINRVAPFVDRGQPGGWNDLDMLEVGLGGMTDDEYIAHFSMWAALKSPLLIGADLRKLDHKALSILSNPAVIAVNQDPLGRSAVRIAQDFDVKTDKYGQGETQIWSGPLYGGKGREDQLLIFLNAADEDVTMATSLNDIFVHEGPEGSAPHTKLAYNIHDLWERRMPEHSAQQILGGGPPMRDWYNSTETPYTTGLDNSDERLLGTKIGRIGPDSPDFRIRVRRHAIKMYRLRPAEKGATRYAMTKTEL